MNCIQIDDREWFYSVHKGHVTMIAPDGSTHRLSIADVMGIRDPEPGHVIFGTVTPQHIRNYVATRLAIHNRENQEGEIFTDGTHDAECPVHRSEDPREDPRPRTHPRYEHR